ncbi:MULTISPECIES: response regulator [Arthrobacter]|uniref:Transcriptional regulatory protein n=2 Tax=Arthrobacter TaxID=1663 RepID=A0ABU9KNL7_9MICC|nr:response regulator [Arthrobacter sp. YJM1]MDP5228493.1 response regulator [Arthrobacter sp. YJM1]
MNPIRVLVVEDEPIAREAHLAYVARLSGFTAAGSASSGQEALRELIQAQERGEAVDLVLLDMNLPDLHGLDVARRMRSAGFLTDIIAITAVRELNVVRGAIATGVVQYLIKPFTYATFAEKLENYRAFRATLGSDAPSAGGSSPAPVDQSAVDQAFATLRTPVDLPLPKGISAATLAAVRELVTGAPAPLSASELAELAQLSRVTARRYLEHLVSAGVLKSSPRYGTPGRPENEYRGS